MGIEELSAYASIDRQEGDPQQRWEAVTINDEQFLVKRDLLFPAHHEGQDVLFRVDEYHHPEAGIQMHVFKLGMDRPTTDPSIVRADYGCPCMSFGDKFTIPGHDCGKQRTMMLDTIAELGIGAMAIVSEQTAAGNGHGTHAVFEQSSHQYEARMRGETVPTMTEAYSQLGYFPFDARRHDIVASALAHSLGKERPIIPAMSSPQKIQQLADAGLNIVPTLRVELHTDTTGAHYPNLRRDGYAERLSHPQPGAYLVETTTNGSTITQLTPQTYQATLIPRFQSSPRPRLSN